MSHTPASANGSPAPVILIVSHPNSRASFISLNLSERGSSLFSASFVPYTSLKQYLKLRLQTFDVSRSIKSILFCCSVLFSLSFVRSNPFKIGTVSFIGIAVIFFTFVCFVVSHSLLLVVNYFVVLNNPVIHPRSECPILVATCMLQYAIWLDPSPPNPCSIR